MVLSHKRAKTTCCQDLKGVCGMTIAGFLNMPSAK